MAIFGITLKEFAKMQAQGEKLKASRRTQRMLLKFSNKKIKVKDIQDMPLTDFLDCERYLKEENFKGFCAIFVTQRFYYFHNVKWIIEEYARQKTILYDVNMWAFNPPQYGEPAPETVGSELRKDFVEEFGSYVVLMDMVMSWDKTGYKAIEQWKVSEFFFWANYLSGQRILERVK